MANLHEIKISQVPKVLRDENTMKIDIERLKQVEKVVITGDELRTEVYNYLLKKMKDFGEVVEISSTSFRFEIDQKGKKITMFATQKPHILLFIKGLVVRFTSGRDWTQCTAFFFAHILYKFVHMVLS